MIKKSLLFVLLFAAFFGVARADVVEIGDGGTTNNTYLPGFNYYNYSLTQQIYTADEIGMAGTITSIAFKNTGTEKTRTYNIYMLSTDKETFESGTDWVAMSDGDLVFAGELTFTVGEWTTIDLDTPFAYDGTSNLLVGVSDVSGAYSSSPHMACLVFDATSQAIRAYRDTPGAYDITAPGVTGSVLNVKNQIQLSITPSGGSICEKPATLEVSDITTNGATFTWTGGSGSYNFAWKKASEEDWVTNPTTLYEYTLTTLEPGTNYDVRVQSVCDGDATSGWKTANFATNYGIPFNEAFATSSVPTNWTKYVGLLGGVMADTIDLQTTSSGWNFNTGNNVFDKHAKLNIYGENCKYWLVTPSLAMEDNVQLTFDLALTRYSTSDSPTAGNQADDKFVVLITTDAGTTWEILREWNNTDSEYVYDEITNASTGQAVAIDLSSYAGQNIAVAFYGESTVSGGDNNLHIDNVSIDYIPDCAKPTGLNVVYVNTHTAMLSWTSDASAWQVQLDDEEPIDVDETTYTFTELAPETDFTAKVRANCGGTYSDWTNAVNFTTGIACPVPTDFSTSNVTNHGATLTWVSNASEWIVAYKTGDEENFTEITVNDITYTFTTLEPETSYIVKVKAVCGGIDGESAWTSTRSFTTLVACPAPNNLTCTALTSNTATLDWTERGDATEWDLQYWKGTDTTLVTVTEKPYTLSELITENIYKARVRSACGSDWSSVVEFEPTAKLIIGSGTATSGYLPTNTNYDFSFTQQIYTVAELGAAGVIESIDFYMTSTNAYTRNLDIYMVSTDKNSFESATDWITVTDADKVFSGEVAFAAASWTTITLENSFIYDGTQNVAIVVDDNTDAWSSRSFKTFTASAQQALYKYQDNNDIPINFSGSGTSTTSKNQIRILKSEMSSCMKPTNLTIIEIGPDFVTLSWTENGESTEWEVNYNTNTASANINDNFVLDNLEPETEYTITVAPTCDPTLVSNAVTFTTLAACPAPDNIEVSNITHYTADVTWTGFSDTYNVVLGQDGEPETLLSANYESGTIPTQFVNDETYAWTVTDTLSSSYCMRSGNPGVGSSTSAISVTVTYPANGIVEFDAECRGEGTSTYWDHCDFYIDDERVLFHGADLTDEGWLHYSFPVAAGEHTFKWSYTKDSSVNQPGDYFAVDNIMMFSTEIVWGEPVTDLSDAEYTFTGLTPSTNYYVKVQGFCGSTPGEESAVVPFSTLSESYKIFVTEGNWNVANNWSPAGVPTIDQDVELRANVTITDAAAANNITQGAYTITIDVTENGRLTHNNAGVTATVKKTLAGYGANYDPETNTNANYHFISSPLSIGVSPDSENVSGLLRADNKYDLYDWYAYTLDSLEWRNYKVEQFYIGGMNGYLYANEDDTELSFTGSLNSSQTAKSYYANVSSGYTFGAFSLLGNPFVCDAYLVDAATDGAALACYRMNDAGNGYTAVEGAIHPMEGVFYEATVAANVYMSRTAPAPSSKLNVAVSQDRGMKDNAIIRFGEGNTLRKFNFRENATRIYIPQNNNDYAVVNAENEGEMPVNFKAEENGTYTLSFNSENVEFGYLHLIDNMTGNDVDLLATPSYTFDARTTDYASRFKLVFATGNNSNSQFAFISNGEIILNGIDGNTTVQLFDVTGRMISSTNSANRISIENMAAGVYVLRLVNGNNVKSQKIVIK